ncbi:MAG: hypothetical protein M2R46_03768 [Verrucomicrobia subdivision 3 bacterium]|nr:hypothetical protein [Limisphaerales bacterium]
MGFCLLKDRPRKHVAAAAGMAISPPNLLQRPLACPLFALVKRTLGVNALQAANAVRLIGKSFHKLS